MKQAKPKIVRNYQSLSGDKPFRDWLLALRDRKARAIIRTRINRLRQGNFGDCSHLGARMYELRIHYGPGYRVYFGDLDDNNLVLLYGGIKSAQSRDIKKAKEYWQEYE